MDDRTPLASLLEPTHADVARLIRDPNTSVERMNTPFLLRGRIFRVEWRGPYKPVTLTVGYAGPPNFTVLLAANPAGFNELAARAGVTLETDEQRVAYAVTQLEATRRFDETFVVLRRFDDMRPMGAAPPAAQARYQAIQAAYAAKIVPPRSVMSDTGWTVPVYVLSRNDLCLFTVSIARDGASTVLRTVVEADAPLLPRAAGP